MILVKVSLKMLFGAMVVYSTQPSLYVHDVNMNLWMPFALIRRALLNFG